MRDDTHSGQTPLRGAVILDGALGSELARRGHDVSDALWSARVLLDAPEAIEQVHLDYLAAGADLITTASYQVSFEGFARAGLRAADAELALAESVAIARRAREKFVAQCAGAADVAGAGRAIRVAASVGPYGATLADGSEFHGNYGVGFDALVEFHRRRLAVLTGAGADLLACETLPSLEEARAILAALRDFPAAPPAWFSFTCRDARHTAHGEPLRECAGLLHAEPAVAAIGVNCTAPQFVASLVRELRAAMRQPRAAAEKPIVAYPNRGQQWDAARRQWSGPPATDDWATLARQWHAAGARWLGGCCGTTPADIAALKATQNPKDERELLLGDGAP
jgi:homocysteine S-methyltransferase